MWNFFKQYWLVGAVVLPGAFNIKATIFDFDTLATENPRKDYQAIVTDMTERYRYVLIYIGNIDSTIESHIKQVNQKYDDIIFVKIDADKYHCFRKNKPIPVIQLYKDGLLESESNPQKNVDLGRILAMHYLKSTSTKP